MDSSGIDNNNDATAVDDADADAVPFLTSDGVCCKAVTSLLDIASVYTHHPPLKSNKEGEGEGEGRYFGGVRGDAVVPQQQSEGETLSQPLSLPSFLSLSSLFLFLCYLSLPLFSLFACLNS